MPKQDYKLELIDITHTEVDTWYYVQWVWAVHITTNDITETHIMTTPFNDKSRFPTEDRALEVIEVLKQTDFAKGVFHNEQPE